MPIGSTIDITKNQECTGVLLMSQEDKGAEVLRRASLGDVEARLQLVKQHLNLVAELAAGYALRTGYPFSLMVRAGTVAIIKAANDFHCYRHVAFDDHVKSYVIRAMEDIDYA